MKVAVLTVAYNESEYIEACIEQWKGLVDEHLVLVSTWPWNGTHEGDDGTAEKAEGATVVRRYWETEAIQRDWGLGYLYDYDFVLIVDPDEFYTLEDRKKILSFLGTDEHYKDAYKIEKMITYWKHTDYVFEPIDRHKPVIAVNPKTTRFYEHRQTQPFDKSYPFTEQVPTISVVCHHMSWVHSDDKVKEKISSYSHRNDIALDWFEEVWKKWTPNSSINIRPYGEKTVAKFSPAPEEITKCF